ncbi:MAG TPA: magnesium chelatase [Firmicutes bacterium]|nr:magnesium chelatase [Bacillota bacterium]
MRNYLKLIRHEGNASLFLALETSVISLLAGRPIHVHVEGLRGTGKTTIIRGARSILPSIERVKGCVYNCHPRAPHCPEHRGLSEDDIARIGTEEIDMPFLEISHAAKIGTVVGTLDLSKMVDRTRPEAALLPGILPRANRGIVFIDEINRLADTSPELTDILLDIMGTKPGRLQVEEAGFQSFEIPVTLCVWAASNPDEEPGALEDIRRQLSDRFDFTVNMGRPSELDVVKEILMLSEQGSGEDGADLGPEIEVFRSVIAQRAARYGDVKIGDDLRSLLAEIYVDFGLESLRSIESIALGAKARAAFEGRNSVTGSDLMKVLSLALRHRVDMSTLSSIAKFLEERLEQQKVERRCERGSTTPGGDTRLHDLHDPFKSHTQGQKLDTRGKDGLKDNPNTNGFLERFMSGMGLDRLFKAREHGHYMDEMVGGPGGSGGPAIAQGPSGGVQAPQPDVQVASPPEKARRLSSLPGDSLMFTEEDLRGK